MSYSEAKHPRIYGAAHAVMTRHEKRRDMRVYGAELIPSSGPGLLGFSHHEASDPWVAGTAIPERIVHFMAKKELWERKYGGLGYFLQLIGAFPVNRQNPGHSTIRYAGDLLEDGKLVGAFGEGTRYEDEVNKVVRGNTIGEIRPGLGVLAVRHNVAIYPVGISHLQPDEIENYGRDVKRVVVAEPDIPDLSLRRKDAVEDILVRHRSSLQATYDRANELARRAASSDNF